jgi:hypothetical protein
MKKPNETKAIRKKIMITESQFERLSQNIINEANIKKTRR